MVDNSKLVLRIGAMLVWGCAMLPWAGAMLPWAGAMLPWAGAMLVCRTFSMSIFRHDTEPEDP